MKRCRKYKAYFSVRAGRGSDWPMGFHWSSEVKPNSDPASLWAVWFTDRNDGLLCFFLCLNPQRTAWQRWVTSCPFSLKFLAVQKNPVSWFYPLFIYLFIDVVVIFWATALAKYEFHQKLLSLKITFLICLNTLQPKIYNIFCQRALKLNMDVMNL